MTDLKGHLYIKLLLPLQTDQVAPLAATVYLSPITRVPEVGSMHFCPFCLLLYLLRL